MNKPKIHGEQLQCGWSNLCVQGTGEDVDIRKCDLVLWLEQYFTLLVVLGLAHASLLMFSFPLVMVNCWVYLKDVEYYLKKY